MGWNDRLPEVDVCLPSEDERQAYFDWQEYQHYLAMLDVGSEQQSAPPAPARTGLSSQTIDPDSFGGQRIDIFALPDRTATLTKEPAYGHQDRN